MAKKELMNYTISLINAALYGLSAPLPPNDTDWELMYTLAAHHKLASLLNFAIMTLPAEVITSVSSLSKFNAAFKQELFLDANRQAESARISHAFNDNNIDYVFLKGSVSKFLYPDTCMRSMNDIDILYRSNDDNTHIGNIMESCSYSLYNHTPKDDGWINMHNHIYIELHRRLVEKSYSSEYIYLDNIWSRLKKKSEHEYVMTPEDFYIYHIIHMSKHFRHSGIGIIPFIDTWLYISKNSGLNIDYLDESFKKLGLSDFEQYARKLSCLWFNKDKTSSALIFNPDDFNDKDIQILDILSMYVFNSGSFGTDIQMEVNSMISNSANATDKNSAMIKRIFPNKTIMADYYGDIIEKYPAVIPFFWIYLNFCRLFSKKSSLKRQKEIFDKITDKKIANTKKLMEELFKL